MALHREFAPAKVNLTLEILGKRTDGYHELQSLVAFASDVGDVLTLDTSKPAGVTLSGPFASSISGANLIDTTMQIIAKIAPDLQLGAIHLEKTLPVAAGIGGGSADAAAVIRAVKAVNPSSQAAVDWIALAMKIGADVPVCLTSRLAWMCGLGERVTPAALSSPTELYAVIVNPLAPVPADKTAQVFRTLRAPPYAEGSALQTPALPLQTRQQLLAAAVAGCNALEASARLIVPSLDEVLEALSASPGNVVTRMSGGGPTCFALFETEPAAQAAAKSIAAAHSQWWVRATNLH